MLTVCTSGETSYFRTFRNLGAARNPNAEVLQFGAAYADTQDTLVDAVENAEGAEIKRAVFRALTRLRAATIKEFDTIARLETQAIDACAWLAIHLHFSLSNWVEDASQHWPALLFP